MNLAHSGPLLAKPVHNWLRQIRIAYVPSAATDRLVDQVAATAVEHFRRLGHVVLDVPDPETEVLLTSAPFGVSLGWREALMFTGRKRFGLNHTPTIYTLLSITPERLQLELDTLAAALAKDPPDPADFRFEGLAENAYRPLIEQGQRGGPILSLLRRMQAQAKSIRLILVVGAEQPQAAYFFDLVGAHPRVSADDREAFYADIVMRIATSVSTREITRHQVMPETISRAAWDDLSTPAAMRAAGRELGQRGFFTEMIRPTDLAMVPAVPESLASQYSEGCFATWEPRLPGLVATVTGSARPVVKDNITDDDLAIIVGVRPDGLGAQVRHVQNKRNDPPSSEAVEMIDMDLGLPRITLGPAWGEAAGQVVPVTRSKLHGHRGVASYDPARAEFVPLDPPYYHYPVSCSTEAQARAIKAAFSRSEALSRPDDPRQIVFTVLPGHGVVMGEKWVPGAAPFQAFWEAFDRGDLAVENHVPQGPHTYEPGPGGRRVLRL